MMTCADTELRWLLFEPPSEPPAVYAYNVSPWQPMEREVEADTRPLQALDVFHCVYV